jgi:hypothetical protein
MKRVFPLIAVFAAIFIWAMSASMARAAMNHAAWNNRAGREIIVSGSATNHDLHLNWLRSFDTFQSNHPAIARAFWHNPTLVVSSRFRHEHPEWAGFVSTHPDIARDIAANPGNYVVIEPRYAAAFEQYRHTMAMSWQPGAYTTKS